MAEPTPFNRPAWYDDPRVQGVIAQLQGFGQQVGQQLSGLPQSLASAYDAANAQAERVPFASGVAGLGRRGSEILHEWSSAANPTGVRGGGIGSRADVAKTREALARVYDFVVPQDALGASLAAFPPVRGLRVGEHTKEVIGKGANTGQILAKKQNIAGKLDRSLPWEHGAQPEFRQFLSKYDDEPGRPVLRVYSSGAPDELRGTGAGMAAYTKLADEALDAGLPLASDQTLSIFSQAIYKAFKKRGYTVIENPNTMDMGEGWRTSTDHMPIYQVVAKPMLPEHATKVSSFPALDTMPTVTRGKAIVEKSPESFVYHATNIDNAFDIADEGLVAHGPSFGTDQSSWPDGSTRRRSYFANTLKQAQPFAPEQGRPITLRVNRESLPGLRAESGTGDFFVSDQIGPGMIEARITPELAGKTGLAEGWHPIGALTRGKK